MYAEGLQLCKRASCNLVLVNDTSRYLNLIVTPEESYYGPFGPRTEAFKNLVEMTLLRSHLTFTRSTVVGGQPVPWSSPLVPDALRQVINYCIEQGAYKPIGGITTGHFAAKLDDQNFLTSIRRTDFNKIAETGLVQIRTDGPDSVIAYGAKPSVGGQSQRIVFDRHKDLDCIVHFHCPILPDSKVPIVSQREFECGSHECGRNTAEGLRPFATPSGTIYAVHLDNHGPNIVFHRSINPYDVMTFIRANFALGKKTGGYSAALAMVDFGDNGPVAVKRNVASQFTATAARSVDTDRADGQPDHRGLATQ